MKKIGVLLCVLLLAACSRSNDFLPTAEMTGEDIFKNACIECHQPEGGAVMILSAEMKDVDAISNKVLTGSMAMPAFPNIQGEPAKKLSEYVLANSKVE